MSIASEDWIGHHARYSPGREAVHDLASNRRLSYLEFDRRIDRAALYLLHGLDIGAGDRIAVLCHNDIDAFEIQFACRRIGAIFMPLNWRLAVPELEFICNDATPKVLVHGVEFVGEAVTNLGRLGLHALHGLARAIDQPGAAAEIPQHSAREEFAVVPLFIRRFQARARFAHESVGQIEHVVDRFEDGPDVIESLDLDDPRLQIPVAGAMTDGLDLVERPFVEIELPLWIGDRRIVGVCRFEVGRAQL